MIVREAPSLPVLFLSCSGSIVPAIVPKVQYTHEHPCAMPFIHTLTLLKTDTGRACGDIVIENGKPPCHAATCGVAHADSRPVTTLPAPPATAAPLRRAQILYSVLVSLVACTCWQWDVINSGDVSGSNAVRRAPCAHKG